MANVATETTTLPISALSLLNTPEARDPEIPTNKAAQSAMYPKVPRISGKGILMVGNKSINRVGELWKQISRCQHMLYSAPYIDNPGSLFQQRYEPTCTSEARIYWIMTRKATARNVGMMEQFCSMAQDAKQSKDRNSKRL